MKIKERLLTGVSIQIISALAIGAVLLISSQAIDKASDEEALAAQIVREVLELNALTHEYLLHKGVRSQLQWQAQYEAIENLLAQAEKFRTPAEQAVLENIREDHHASKIVFSRLVRIEVSRQPTGKDEAGPDALIPEMEDRLAAQILIRSQAMKVAATQLSQSSIEGRENLRAHAKHITFFLIALLILIATRSSFLFYRSVVPPMTALREGTEIIAAGRLDHRIIIQSQDEIGQVARSFNEMASQLQESYARLEERVEQRTAKLSAALMEREVLLKEIHHRVKNNMQVISSLLQLQTNFIENPEAQQVFADSQGRIRSMALIHEKLYQSANLTQINFADYIQNLVSMLREAQGERARRVLAEVSVIPMHIGIDSAIPAGLILNELVSNCFKHGYPDGRSGRIDVTLEERGSEEVALTVRDDGVSPPPGFDPTATHSLGLQLVHILAHQMAASLTFQFEKGFACELVFASNPDRQAPSHAP